MTTASSHVPDEFGRFGPFGRRFVPETLMRALEIGPDQLIEGSYSDMLAGSD